MDPAGNELAVAMPRYQMSPEDIADLIAYLKRIEADRDPGLTETSYYSRHDPTERRRARRDRRGDEGRANCLFRKRQRQGRNLQSSH